VKTRGRVSNHHRERGREELESIAINLFYISKVHRYGLKILPTKEGLIAIKVVL